MTVADQKVFKTPLTPTSQSDFGSLRYLEAQWIKVKVAQWPANKDPPRPSTERVVKFSASDEQGLQRLTRIS